MFPRNAKPEWSGIAPGCSHPDRDPNRDRLHDNDRQIGQLRQAGITEFRPADLSWCRGDIGRFSLPRDFAVLVPGSAPHRPVKRWPAARYQALAEALRARGLTPVVVGSATETTLARDIPAAIDLTGQTSFGDLADLGRAARVAVGNDTGTDAFAGDGGLPVRGAVLTRFRSRLCAPARTGRADCCGIPTSRRWTSMTVLAELPHPGWPPDVGCEAARAGPTDLKRSTASGPPNWP